MRYIEKSFDSQVVLDYEKELRSEQLDEMGLNDPNVHSSLSGADIYAQVTSMPSFNRLQEQMVADQGNICCYCGQRLEWRNHPYFKQYTVEHVLPKSRFRSLAGEYKNLLLSCHMQDEEVNKDVFHCDKSKEDKVLSHSPLDSDCDNFFQYYVDGTVHGTEDDKDVDILNLNSGYLKRRRMAAIEGVLFNDDELVDNDELEKCRSTFMKRDDRGWYAEFSFVIVGVIDHLLSE